MNVWQCDKWAHVIMSYILIFQVTRLSCHCYVTLHTMPVLSVAPCRHGGYINIQVQLYIITNVRLLCRLGACPCHFQMLVGNSLRYVVVKGTVPTMPFICWKCLHVAVFQCMLCQSRQFGKEGVSLNFKTILVIGGVWSWVEMGGCKSHTLQGSRK